MGACDIYVVAVAKDMGTAFDNAVKDAEHDYGHDPYNGTISTIDNCANKTSYFNSLLGDKRKTKKWVAECRDKFAEEAMEACDKRECWGTEIPWDKSGKTKKKFLFIGWASC